MLNLKKFFFLVKYKSKMVNGNFRFFFFFSPPNLRFMYTCEFVYIWSIIFIHLVFCESICILWIGISAVEFFFSFDKIVYLINRNSKFVYIYFLNFFCRALIFLLLFSFTNYDLHNTIIFKANQYIKILPKKKCP